MLNEQYAKCSLKVDDQYLVLSDNQNKYCKRGNIRGALIFVNFAQNSASANSKTHKNICNILYAHFGQVGVVYWPCVLMQMGNILENVWGLLCFCAAQLLVMYDVSFVQYKNYKWASAKCEFNNPGMFLCWQTRKINPANLTAFTVRGPRQPPNIHCHEIRVISLNFGMECDWLLMSQSKIN